jgi:hypothetical protein
MSGVDYPKVVDLLTDTIKELNQPCVAPAVPAERTAEERKKDAADVLRALLHELEGSGAAAAAEHGASADKWRPYYGLASRADEERHAKERRAHGWAANGSQSTQGVNDSFANERRWAR